MLLRWIAEILGLFISGVGVAVTKRGLLGVSPVSSVANIISLRFDFISFGTWLFLWNCILILGQIIILRKDFKPFQLLQIPLSVLFGYFTDIGVVIAGNIPNDIYIYSKNWIGIHWNIDIGTWNYPYGKSGCAYEFGRSFREGYS